MPTILSRPADISNPRLEALYDARRAIINADAYADAVGMWNGAPIFTAETVRHLEAIGKLIAEAAQ